MKKVLFIAYNFPPVAGAGTIRVVKFIKYLPQFGWEPIVLTVDRGFSLFSDEYLVKDIPADTKVYGTPIIDLSKIYRRYLLELFHRQHVPQKTEYKSPVQDLRNKTGLSKLISQFLNKYIYIPDNTISWLFGAVKKGIEIIDKEEVNVIYSTSVPYTAHLIAYCLKKLRRIPWVADFRDPWTQRYLAPGGIRGKIEAFLERKVVEFSDYVLTTTPATRNDFAKRYATLPNSKFKVIWNGYDSEDFVDVKPIHYDRFTIVFSGILYDSRNPEPFFQAISELIQERKFTAQDINIIFIGDLGQSNAYYLQKFRLESVVRHLGYIPHSEVIKYLLNASVLLMINNPSKESQENLSLPSKTFEYLGTGRPILSITPIPSMISEFMNLTGGGEIVSPEDVNGIKSTIYDMYAKYKQGQLKSQTKTDISVYERKELSRRLSEIFEIIVHKKTTSDS